jgi:hypothetical protein
VALGLIFGAGVGLVARGDLRGDGRGVGVGICAASFGLTGSARRTSGSAGGAEGTKGVTLGITVTVGVGGAVDTSAVATGVELSAGWACGAMILSDAVAVATGDVPGAGVGRGLSRCTSRIHFITMNPTTKTTTPITNGRSDPRLPLLLLRLRTVIGRLGSGSGASCR